MTTSGSDNESVTANAERALREHAQQAEERLSELEADLSVLNDHGTIQEDRDGARRAIESTRSDLSRVRAALERIASGTYGRCTGCGEPIAPERLAAIPEAEHCHRCA
jgi:RNA polymerase-binding transcription factor DksA